MPQLHGNGYQCQTIDGGAVMRIKVSMIFERRIRVRRSR
jgi:hypothetical protein